MRVGIVSIYYNAFNYAAQLQARALVQIVKEYGYECEQICYDATDEKYPFEKSIKEKIKEIKSQWELFSEKEKEAILTWLANAHEDLVKFFNWEKTSSNFKIFDWSWKEVLSLTDFLKSKK